MSKKLTEPRRYVLLREIANIPDGDVFRPYRGVKTLCARLEREGLLTSAGISVMVGGLYIISDAGRAVAQGRADE